MSVSSVLITIRRVPESFNKLPWIFRYGTFGFITSIFTYNAFGAYIDSKQELLDYRETGEKYRNEWEAVKCGARINSWQRFKESIVWPITITQNIIPYIVLQLNKKETKENNDKEK